MSAELLLDTLVDDVRSALSEFASKHAASLSTAAADPRAPEFRDDWCALVETIHALTAALTEDGAA